MYFPCEGIPSERLLRLISSARRNQEIPQPRERPRRAQPASSAAPAARTQPLETAAGKRDSPRPAPSVSRSLRISAAL